MATTFADQLRSLPDEALGALIQLRPDLVVPVPADISALAVRAQSRNSVARCLDGLDEFTLTVLDAARLSRAADTALTSVDDILQLAGEDVAEDARAAIDRLRVRFLLHGPPEALHVVGAVDEVTSPYPAGLGRPADFLDPQAAALCADRAKLRRTVLAAPPGARAVLDRLAAGPPVGALNRDSVAEPVRWLVDQHVLVPVSEAGRAPRPDGELVELPREVGMLLRRDTGPLGVLRPVAPVLDGPARDPRSADSAGAGQTMEAVRATEALLEALATEPAPVLRTGGLGVRDLKRLAKAAGIDEAGAALLVETTYAAGLLGESENGTGADNFLPTGQYDLWRSTGIAHRWAALARAWLAMTRQPGLIGRRDERDRPINALAPDAERAGAPQARREALAVLGDLDPGTAPPVDALLGLLTWQAPRRSRGREAAHRDAWAGAAMLGITGLGALTSYSRVLLTGPGDDGDDPLGVLHPEDSHADAVRTLDQLLPEPVDHILVQADLTVVVPGPPEPELAGELDVLAEPESAGGASVFRVTPASVRRAFDVGYQAADLHDLFRRRSRTPVPQTLTYLIDDAARRHGGLRSGSAGSYLRSDDEALLAEVVADKRLGTLEMRRIAPTVLVSPRPVARLLGALREVGYAPVAEDAGGATVLTRPKTRRAPSRSARIAEPAAPLLTGPRLAGVVEQLRRGDVATRAARRAPVTVRAAHGQAIPGLTAVQQHTQAMAVLQQAVRDKARVWVGYVDSHGATLSRLVRPVSMSAGYLRAEDERGESLHTFALHRITAAVTEE
ncbi:helicase-associated domain-containing protein [Actinoplanes couchii]|uniref:Helicase XPB/Ssl2 N-terminal domain-containing protein n=1 Tax=Actinoplanes couchii TaxID=403638 RepID=A0ABQ3XPU6_9ACTN|nr:helicase-associated domain-containing protein [Actinoplanes couchii]MDR6323824.1 hypothetical protein [Actinoplanes couchii]GID60541.1 hypothetical protein Aco03nite_089450 [Actinoplanes couchii]